MKTFTSLIPRRFLSGNLKKTLLILGFCLMGFTSAFADHDYISGDITFTDKGDYFQVKVLGTDYDGTNDELDDVCFYYLHPLTGKWIKFFHGDMDNEDKWEKFGDTSSDVGSMWTSKSGDLKYGHFNYTYPKGLFPGYILFKVEADWDLDSNQDNDGIDHTFYYSIKGVEHIDWDEYWDTDYDPLYRTVSFDFLYCEIYGDGTTSSDLQYRHELDEIKLEYYYNNKWYPITSASSKEKKYDRDLKIYNTSSTDKVTVKTSLAGNESASDRHLATITWEIPDYLMGTEARFRMQRDWDVWADQNSSGYDDSKEFTINLKDYYAPQNVTAQFNKCAGEVALTWNCNQSHSKKSGFQILRKEEGGAWTLLNSDNLLSPSTDSYVDATIEHDKTYQYMVRLLWSDSNIRKQEAISEAIGTNLIPIMPPTPEITEMVDEDENIEFRITWDYDCSITTKLTLWKRNVETQFTEQIPLDISKNSYLDQDVKLCTPYKYKLVAENAYGQAGSEYQPYLAMQDLDGVMQWFKASKGYYSNMIKLSWGVQQTSLIGQYEISRRIYGGDNPWELVKIIDNGNSFTWIDEDTDPGLYYEYQIVGVGDCGDSQNRSNELTTIGFRMPQGIVSGQVNYEGGMAVENVRVALEASGDGQVLGSCLQTDGSGVLTIPREQVPDLSQGFTLETWINPQGANDNARLFEQGTGSSGFELTYSSISSTFGFRVGATTLSFEALGSSEWEEGEWNHVAVSVASGTATIYLNGEQVASKSGVTLSVVDTDLTMAGGFSGYMDDIRLWKAGTHGQEEIVRDYTRILSGEETGLAAYWRLDENLGTFIFDSSKSNGKFNEVHGSFVGAQWSSQIPPTNKLAICGVTDALGNFLINGIRYKGSGETFMLVPSFGQHSFEPQSRAVFIGDGAMIYSNQDFKDISSFKVTGNVKYKGSLFPVGNVDILVDGKGVIGEDNRPVVSDELGNFSVQVPIGEHFISFGKYGHTFENAYWPGVNEDGSIKRHNFQKAESGLIILDTTKVKVVGRIVGGTVEGDKPIGFGLSKNNLGTATVSLESKYGIDTEGNRTITITTDPVSGEYEAFLIPEKFIVSSVGNSSYSFSGSEDLTELDLTSAFTEYEDVYEGDRCVFNKRRDWIYREKPSVSVTGIGGNPIFSEKKIEMEAEDGTVEKVSLVDVDGNQLFGFPVFCMNNRYKTIISVFEQYVNSDNHAVDKVPVSDGTVYINNSLSKDESQQKISLEEDGTVEYVFYGGFPNINEDIQNPDHNYTKTMQLVVRSGPNEANASYWPSESEPFRGYCFGARPTGNNFVTTGPAVNLMILRDPPGSNSHTSYSQGSSFASKMSFGVSDAISASKSLNVSVGASTTFGGGLAGPQVELKAENSEEIGMEIKTTCTGNQSMSYSVTTSKTWSTSSAPDYVGAPGDLFVGYSSNIVFGKSVLVTLVKDGDTYKVGTEEGFRMTPEFETAYQYTANHIENYLIPNLEMLRNNFLAKSSEHTSHVALGNEKYGSSNTDKLVWGNLAVDKSLFHDGPSYTFHPSSGEAIDSVHFYNQQIQHWKDLLANNEEEKLSAQKTENISFDAGTTYTSETSFEKSESSEFSFEFMMGASLAQSLGFTANEVGAVAATKVNMEASISTSTGDEVGETQTFAFELNDPDAGDYYSVDICDPKSNNGPVFRTKGGQTSCPYEGATVTKYYRPGEELSAATMAIELPELEVENAIAAEIPESQPAFFTLKLRNNSETEDDNWFRLVVDAASNPNGAKVKVDGGSMNSGVAVLVPAGKTVTKTIEVTKGRSDINDYENLQIILHSQCQYDPTDDVDDIADTVAISAFFIPACTNVTILEPKENWVVNVASRDTLPITITDYNIQYGSFENIALQYKPATSGSWTTFMNFFNDSEAFQEYDGAKELIDGRSKITYLWDMTDYQDRSYQIRAISKCSDGSVNESEILTGVLDGKRPKLFGTPQPADGVLSPNDEIMIQFDEIIEKGLVNNYNFSVQGILNSNELNHGTSLQFDGVNDYGVSGEGIQINDKSFTVEFWMQKATTAGGTVFSQGEAYDEQITIGFRENLLVISLNGEEHTGEIPIFDGLWHHWAIGYDNTRQAVYAYQDDQLVLDDPAKGYTGHGKVFIGKDPMSQSGFFKGNLHDLRVWTKSLTLSEVTSQMNSSLTGFERGLVGYWPMDEAYGTLAADKVHSRHAEIHADWLVSPRSTSYLFDGTGQALSYQSGTIPLTDDMDFTLEFWFNTTGEAYGSCLFSNGHPEQTDVNSTWTIELDQTGALVVNNNNTQFLAAPAGFADGNWHHFSLVMNRLSNLTCYIDGEKKGSLEADGFGSFDSPRCFIGARGYVDQGGEIHLDNYYKGTLDEVRFWNLARKQEQLKRYMNHKLENDAFGLKAYFPFESYTNNSGVMESTPTLEDQSIDEYSETGQSNCGVLSVVGSESFSDNTPNIKRLLPKQSLNYSFAVNEDKIILTPTDPASMLEKCNIEITVLGIEDTHGNRMASPISWTAFVDKNQVDWAEESRSFEKELLAPLTYTTTIRNTGGQQESFSIENLPAWLTADPQSGIIDPVSSMDISFTVAEGLNIGEYNQDIYLHTNLGFDEKFLLNIRVYKPGPEWAVDRSKYQNSMNVIGQIQVGETISTDKYDLVAAFIDGECRGVSNLEYIPAYDSYMVFLDLFANTDGKKVTLKVWDASEGLIYSDVTPNLVFQSNEMHGMPSAPITIKVNNEVEQEIALKSGWNWISFNMESDLFSNVPDALGSLSISENDLIKSGDGKFEVFSGSHWGGTISSSGGLSCDKMYMLKVAQDDSLVIRGAVVDPSSVEISLKPGWNWIGFLPSINMPINEALANFNPQTGDVMKSQRAFAYYDANLGWLGTLKYLKPGEGYLFKSQQAAQFHYPTTSFLKSQRVDENYPVVEEAAQFENNMPAIIEVVTPQPVALDDDYVLFAYSNGELRGVAKPSAQEINHKKIFFMTLYGESSEEEFSFELKYRDKKWETSDHFAFNASDVKGSVESPYPLFFNMESSGIDQSNGGESFDAAVFPTVMDDHLNIMVQQPNGSEGDIKVYNSLGQLMKVVFSGRIASGQTSFFWNGDTPTMKAPAGIYYVVIRSGDERKTVKVIRK